MKTMNSLLTLAVFSAAMPLMHAQTADFNLDSIAAKAKEKAEITLDGPLLSMALQNAPDNVKSMLQSLTRVIVRNYEFDKEGQYTDADLNRVRRVVNGSGWSRILQSKEEHENVEIYVQTKDGKANGFLLISEEPKELTVINAAGSLDLARVQELVRSNIKFDLASLAGQGAKQ